MKHIKLFENFDNKLNKELLIEYYNVGYIGEHTINMYGSVDVDGDVDFRGLEFDEIPFKFGKVTGNFKISKIKIKDLTNSPREVGGDFIAEECGLTTLIGGPIIVGGIYDVYDNKLKSLEGAPSTCSTFDCRINHLETLEHSPQTINGNFYCGNNILTSLLGGPKIVNGDFDCRFSSFLKSFIGSPQEIHGDYNCEVTGIKTLIGLTSDIDGYLFSSDNLKLIYNILKVDLECVNNFYNFNILDNLEDDKQTLNMKRLRRFIELYDLKELSEEQLKELENNFNII